MIELNSKTQQDFLNREWVEKLLKAGVDMNDAKYFICGNFSKDAPQDYIALKKAYPNWNDPKLFDSPVPTYTLSELLLKLDEWPYKKGIKNYNGDREESESSGGLTFFKDAPFYCFFYKDWGDSQLTCTEYPITSAANLLIWCMKNEVGCVGDISNK